MFSLTIVFGPGPMVWTLMFKTEERARREYQEMVDARHPDNDGSSACAILRDDFGQECEITVSQISGFMLEDLEQSKLAHIERELHNLRTKLKANEIADTDPQIRQARRNQQAAMPMLQPMPGGMVGPNGRFPS